MKRFDRLAYASSDDMVFGRALHPVRCGLDLVIGAGEVYPEVNFTLPTMKVIPDTLDAVLSQYEDMINGILGRLVKLDMPGALIEFEHLPQMTRHIEIGARITEILKSKMHACREKTGLKTALRATICDLREMERPPLMRSGKTVEKVLQAFRMAATNGADLLSIESTGGKEVNDPAMMAGDVPGILGALGVLAPQDMHFLWHEICEIAEANEVVPAGDTACGFANTAMLLADDKYIPNVLAAVIRSMSAVRTLIAHEEGAMGPTKDCGYEGPVIKAITGHPIALEGKSSACAHFSHMGNIAAATCDAWSNESVQNIKLLSGYAPEVFTEILSYDCRLMNMALLTGTEEVLKNLFIQSDQHQSVHALVIAPDTSFKIAECIITEKSDFQRTRKAGLQACKIIRSAHDDQKLVLPAREMTWLNRVEAELSKWDAEDVIIAYLVDHYGDLFIPEAYGI